MLLTYCSYIGVDRFPVYDISSIQVSQRRFDVTEALSIVERQQSHATNTFMDRCNQCFLFIYIHWRRKRGGGGGGARGACAPPLFCLGGGGGAMVCLCPPTFYPTFSFFT